MFNKIYEYIKKYDTIIITRHSRPDLDALGSQLGLKQLILDNFENKNVYAIGDMARPCFLGEMDDISNVDLSNALMIFTDVSTLNMIPDVPYDKVAKVIAIDHHNNDCDIEGCEAFYNKNAAAACQIIAQMAFDLNFNVSEKAATCLYTGTVTDTNRFNYSLSKELFDVVGKLIDCGIDYQNLYNTMYADSIDNVKMRAYFVNKFKVDEYGFAYLINKENIFKKFKVDTFTISRGMVNVMANLKGVEIWANFTEDPVTHNIYCEFRSKRIVILDVAKKYGGGGHPLACGATVESFKVVENIIKDFDKLLSK